MTEYTEADAVAELAQQALEPTELEKGTVYAVLGDDGGVSLLDTDAYADHPRFTTAFRTVIDKASFVNYLHKHALEGATEIYADASTSKVIGVIDSHEASTPGWQKHRVTLELQHTKSWEEWTKYNNKWFTQIQFAEFVEQRATDIAEPAPGDLMSLAQKFYMTKGVEYESSQRLDNGETTLVYKEKVATRGLGKIEVPKDLKLVLQPYTNGPRQYAAANFRTRLDGATLQIGYVLVRPEEILEGIFTDIVTEMRDGRPANPEEGVAAIDPITHPIYFGKP